MRTTIAMTAAALLLAADAGRADAQWGAHRAYNPWTGNVYSNFSVRNPLTGAAVGRSQVFNPRTGRGISVGTGFNPWTGNVYRNRLIQNPWLGRHSVTEAYNPWTGSFGIWAR